MKGLVNFITLHKYKIIFSIIIIIGLIFYFQRNKQNKLEQNIKTSLVKRGNLKEIMLLSGEVKSKQYAELHFQTSGKIASFNIKEGDSIEKNQIIATLDQREVRKNLQKDLNDFMKSRWDFDQEKDGIKDKAVTTAMQRILDKSQFDLNNAVIDVELKNLAFEFSLLKSPIDGVVTDIHNIFTGMNITVSNTIATIINPDSLYLELTADQTEVTKLKKTMIGELVLDSYPDNKIEGTINSISFTPKTDESGTVYRVEFSFNNSSNQDQRYRIGMTGDVEFILQEKNSVLYIPIEYLNEENGEKYVFTSNNKGLRKKQFVSTGMETENNIEILQGLHEGQVIYD